VHVLPAQQGCPLPPHVPQLPLMQVMPIVGQVEPPAVQTLFTQQPPESQVVFSQHGSPGWPQAVQTPRPPPVHTSAESQARPAQQACPGPPQAWQTPPTHAPPDWHGVLPTQQLSPSAPQLAPPSPFPPSPDGAPLLLEQPARRLNPRTREASMRIDSSKPRFRLGSYERARRGIQRPVGDDVRQRGSGRRA
jgi:hypothetical protein